MRALLGLFLIFSLGCARTAENNRLSQACTSDWYRLVEDRISTGDDQGHGPDLGSLEWRSVVEFKLGLRDDLTLPPVESDRWCTYINKHIVGKTT